MRNREPQEHSALSPVEKLARYQDCLSLRELELLALPEAERNAHVSKEEQQQFHEHLDKCKACRELLEAYRAAEEIAEQAISEAIEDA